MGDSDTLIIDQAVAFYDAVLAFAPNNTEALCESAVSLCELGRFDEAIQRLEKVLALNPESTLALWRECQTG
jgi:tetratricopeptide (TPR) repeat protein